MLTINGTTISLTRGDSMVVEIGMNRPDGEVYIPVESDSIRFALKRRYSDDEPVLIYKDIPYDTLLLKLESEDTKDMKYGAYVYDIQLTKEDGTVDTFIDRAKFILTEEVD